MNRQGTWWQALTSLALSVLALLTFRWIIFEPYVIPSGSMLPTLRVLDFIYVNKFAYGLRLPFSSTWLFERELPKRCDIVVFRSQTEPGVFLVKRVMGLPGERVELLESGRLRITGRALQTEKILEGDDSTSYREDCDHNRSHLIQLSNDLKEIDPDPVVYAVEVPADELVMIGDNRHASADSRVWGTLPRSDLLGQAKGIWLSCESSLPDTPRLCDPATLRWDRMFSPLDEAP